MAQLIIEYDGRDTVARKIIDALLSLKSVKLKEGSTYDPKFMAKIDQSRKQYKEGKCKVVKTEDLWK